MAGKLMVSPGKIRFGSPLRKVLELITTSTWLAIAVGVGVRSGPSATSRRSVARFHTLSPGSTMTVVSGSQPASGLPAVVSVVMFGGGGSCSGVSTVMPVGKPPP